MSRFHGDKDLWLAAMRVDGPALRTAAAELDPGAAVPGVLVAALEQDRASMARAIRDLGSIEAFFGSR